MKLIIGYQNMNIKEKILSLATEYRLKLQSQIDLRMTEMNSDNNDHYLIYKILGISLNEGSLIDKYQNKGRFLYKYAGSFLEDIALLCFEDKFANLQKKFKIDNQLGLKPKTFEIDCLVGNDAYEIKWRDATTDGDHITKEHTRAKSISMLGYKPIRIMFYYPNRAQAIKIQDTIKDMYAGLGGLYYFGEDAWNFIKQETGTDLKNILEDIAKNII